MRFALLLLLAAGAAPPALAQSAPAAPASPYAGLFTPWTAAEREARAAEARVQPAPAPASADGERRRIAAAALGERVGEIVRMGDCDEGERVARAAGDFALVDAVRAHCRRRDANGG